MILHTADSRGMADFGWLKTAHTFSFGEYYDETRIQFGALRVINDDVIAPGKGFGMHSHHNMEIITIPISGKVAHRDNLGHSSVISSGEVQVMSAGSGVRHSEFNASDSEDLALFQIWVLPHTQGVTPRYDQKRFEVSDMRNQLKCVVASLADSEELGALGIHQNVRFSLSQLSQGTVIDYAPYRHGNGVYIMVISGKITVADQTLSSRDGLGILDAQSMSIVAEEESFILLMDIPVS